MPIKVNGVTIVDDNKAVSNIVNLSANGTITLNSLTYPTTDGSSSQVLQTDGAGNLSFATVNLDNYLQVANSTSFASTSQLDAYLQVANSTGFASTTQLDNYLQVANSTSFASTTQLDSYLQVANSTSFSTTGKAIAMAIVFGG